MRRWRMVAARSRHVAWYASALRASVQILCSSDVSFSGRLYSRVKGSSSGCVK